MSLRLGVRDATSATRCSILVEWDGSPADAVVTASSDPNQAIGTLPVDDAVHIVEARAINVGGGMQTIAVFIDGALVVENVGAQSSDTLVSAEISFSGNLPAAAPSVTELLILSGPG